MTMSSKRSNGARGIAAHPRIPAPVLAALFATLRNAIGRFSLIDMSLPRGQSAGADREAIFACCGDLPDADQQFLCRFRQSGGHKEVHVLPPGRRHPSLLSAMLDPAHHLQKVVVFADSIEQAGSLLDLVESDVSVIVRPAAHPPSGAAAAMASRLQGRRVIAFKSSGTGQAFLWFLPPDGFEAVHDAISLDRVPRKRSGARARKESAGRRTIDVDATYALAIPSHASSHPALVASALIHDGGYRSESDGDYTWLWTGPSNHFRVLLTGIPPGPVKLGISVIKSEDARNIAGLRVLIDGRHVPHGFMPWAGLSGRVTVDLGTPASDMTILSLVCPNMVQDAAGRRLLGLCIDKIEMAS